MSTCFYILCPLSGRGSAKISDTDNDVEFVDSVCIQDTYYRPSIYKVKKKMGNGELEVNILQCTFSGETENLYSFVFYVHNNKEACNP